MTHQHDVEQEQTSVAVSAPTPQKKSAPYRRSGMLFSLTSIFFIFGGLLAFGMRSIEAVRQNESDKKANLIVEQRQLEQMQKMLKEEETERRELQERLVEYQEEIAKSGKISQEQSDKYNAEVKRLQILMGLTPVKGPGISIRLSDNPEASKNESMGPFLPGIVHDFDLLQVVNELRAAKAEAITINGIRVTGFTPIRCVGPTIYINFEPKPAPFVVEAIGDPDELNSAVSMPGGIIESLKNQTLGIRITKGQLSMPAADGVPTVKLAQIDAPKAE